MLSIRPYLFDAYYNWIIDSGMTPYLVIDTSAPGVIAPLEYAVDGELTLDISEDLVEELKIQNDALICIAHFEEGPVELYFPIWSLISLYALETEIGLDFPYEEIPADYEQQLTEKSQARSHSKAGSSRKKPIFSLIKDESDPS